MTLEEQFADLQLTRNEFRNLKKRVLGRHYQELKQNGGHETYNITDVKELFSVMPEIKDETIIKELQKIERFNITNPERTIGYLEAMGEYLVGYQFKGVETNNPCKIVGHSQRKMTFKRCCGRRMIEIHPIAEDQRNGRRFNISKKVHYCSNCGTNYDFTDPFM
jgi:hypothetical protein